MAHFFLFAKSYLHPKGASDGGLDVVDPEYEDHASSLPGKRPPPECLFQEYAMKPDANGFLDFKKANC